MIILDRIDNIINVYAPDYHDIDKDKNNFLIKHLDSFFSILNKYNKNLKLIITLANSMKNNKLLSLLKVIELIFFFKVNIYLLI